MEQSVFKRNFINAKNHWWWLARKKILQEVISKKIKKKDNLNILDFGSGTGINVDLLQKFGEVYIYEPNEYANKFLNLNFKNVISSEATLNNISKKFDLIVLTDVLEHIESPISSLKNIRSLLKDGGKVIITVPAHNYLFSKKDDDLQHFRRYSKKTLKNNLLNANLKFEFFSYYNFFLSPLIILITLIYKILNNNHIDLAEKPPNSIINFLFLKIFSLEKFFISKYIKLPYGVSLFAVATK